MSFDLRISIVSRLTIADDVGEGVHFAVLLRKRERLLDTFGHDQKLDRRREIAHLHKEPEKQNGRSYTKEKVASVGRGGQ